MYLKVIVSRILFSASHLLFSYEHFLFFITSLALAAFSSDPSVWFGGGRVDVGHQDSLGMLAPLLGIGGFLFLCVDRDHRVWGFLGVLVFALCMSLGPILHWKGQVLWEWMPYRFLNTRA